MLARCYFDLRQIISTITTPRPKKSTIYCESTGNVKVGVVLVVDELVVSDVVIVVL